MTRENKLSIVIAFGLLIFVGMLVADHFSIASHREVAALGSNVPTPPLVGTTVLVDGPPPHAKDEPTLNQSGDYIHLVQQGETLRAICRNFYGDSGLASSVAIWNGLSNPNDIEVGSRIALPNRKSLVSSVVPVQQIEQSEKPLIKEQIINNVGTYKVKSGDTLSEIAQKIMGTTKMTQVLINFNKDVMPNPDRIRPGMILKYPK
ncbi:MAG: LysM domain-containing protein [Phycisphaerales bacterium]|jgi:hypothetical protein|nr:LysM domain-containing protein [Phycisphaerales bacterium]